MITADWGTNADGEVILGGSGFHRLGQPADALRRYGGVEVVISDGFDLNQQTGLKPHAEMGVNGSGVDGCDIIVFQRWMHKELPRITEICQRAGQVVIQDVDDWYWGLATSNHAFHAAHPKVNAEVNVNHYRRALGAADAITVSTMYLAERLKNLGRPIALLPNMIDLSRFPAPNTVTWDRPPNVGWTGGIPWRSGDLEELRGIIGPWMAANGLKFIHGGATPLQQHSAAELLDLPHPSNPKWAARNPDHPGEIEVEERPICGWDDYPKLFADMDIFIAPLSDRPFNLAKSNCKLLECSAAGVPYVASRVGPYAAWDGGGRTCRRPKDWKGHLDALLDPANREMQRQAQLDRVATQDVTLRWVDWYSVYEHTARFRTERLVKTMRDLDLLDKQLARKGATTTC